MTPICRLAYESMQLVSHTIQPSVLAVRVDCSWSQACERHPEYFHLLKRLLLRGNAQIIDVCYAA